MALKDFGVSRMTFSFWEHVGSAVRREIVVHGAAFEVLLTGDDLVANLAGPTDGMNQGAFLVTPDKR